MPKKLHKEIPIDYAVCQQQDCPRAEKCLHQIAYRPLIEQPATVLRLLNPTLCTRMGLALLPRLRSRHLRTGFTGMQSRMFPAQYQQFMSILMSHFGRNPTSSGEGRISTLT